MPYQTLARSSSEFFNENFKGAVEWNYGELKPYNTYIAFERYTLFMRKVFEFIFGESLIKANFTSQEETLDVTLSWHNRTLNEKELRELSEISHSAGFEFEFKDENNKQFLILKLEKATEKIFSIYATNDQTIKYLLVLAFRGFVKRSVSQPTPTP